MRTILIAAALLSGTAVMAQTQIKQMSKEEAQARVQAGPPAAWATTGKPNPESDLLVQKLIDWGHATKEPRAFMMAARIVAMRTNRRRRASSKKRRSFFSEPSVFFEIADLRRRVGDQG